MKRNVFMCLLYGLLIASMISGCNKENKSPLDNTNENEIISQETEPESPIKTVQEDKYDEMFLVDDLDEEAEIITSSGWDYCENSLGGITIKSNGIVVDAPLSEVIIPSEIDGKVVTKIGSYCFSDCDFSKVTVPDTVKVIDDFAFYNCHDLKELIVGDNVIKIGDGIAMNCEKLEKVILPEGLNRIGNSAFCNAKDLANINIPSTVVKIGQFAFYNTAITNITIPEGMTTISDSTFASCKQLVNINLPSTVSLIENNAFLDCSALDLQIPSNDNIIVYDTAVTGVKSYNKDIELVIYSGYPELLPDESNKITPPSYVIGEVLTEEEAQKRLEELMQNENYETFNSETDDINFITAPKFD